MNFYAVFLIRPDGTKTIAYVPNGAGGRALFDMERDAENCARTLRRHIARMRKSNQVRVCIARAAVQEITYAPSAEQANAN